MLRWLFNLKIQQFTYMSPSCNRKLKASEWSISRLGLESTASTCQRMFQRSRFSIKPSEINYTCSAIGVTPQDIAREVGRVAGSATQTEMYRPPKLQVFKQTGQYFTLNNSDLHLCRLLEKRGEIETVRVEMIPRHRVPKGVSALLLPRDGGQSAGGTSTEGRWG